MRFFAAAFFFGAALRFTTRFFAAAFLGAAFRFTMRFFAAAFFFGAALRFTTRFFAVDFLGAAFRFTIRFFAVAFRRVVLDFLAIGMANLVSGLIEWNESRRRQRSYFDTA